MAGLRAGSSVTHGPCATCSRSTRSRRRARAVTGRSGATVSTPDSGRPPTKRRLDSDSKPRTAHPRSSTNGADCATAAHSRASDSTRMCLVASASRHPFVRNRAWTAQLISRSSARTEPGPSGAPAALPAEPEAVRLGADRPSGPPTGRRPRNDGRWPSSARPCRPTSGSDSSCSGPVRRRHPSPRRPDRPSRARSRRSPIPRYTPTVGSSMVSSATRGPATHKASPARSNTLCGTSPPRPSAPDRTATDPPRALRRIPLRRYPSGHGGGGRMADQRPATSQIR